MGISDQNVARQAGRAADDQSGNPSEAGYPLTMAAVSIAHSLLAISDALGALTDAVRNQGGRS